MSSEMLEDLGAPFVVTGEVFGVNGTIAFLKFVKDSEEQVIYC